MTGSYLPLLVGLAAPLLVLALVAAGQKVFRRAQGRRAARRANARARTWSKPRLRRPVLSLVGVSGVLVVAAGVAFAVDRGMVPTLVDREPSTTVPAPATRGEERTPAEDPSRGRRDANTPKRPKPKAVSVSVVNAAGSQGLAARRAEFLQRSKVKVKTVATAPTTREESAVFFTRRGARDARRIGRVLDIRRVRRATPEVAALGERAPVTVVLGRDNASGG